MNKGKKDENRKQKEEEEKKRRSFKAVQSKRISNLRKEKSREIFVETNMRKIKKQIEKNSPKISKNKIKGMMKFEWTNIALKSIVPSSE